MLCCCCLDVAKFRWLADWLVGVTVVGLQLGLACPSLPTRHWWAIARGLQPCSVLLLVDVSNYDANTRLDEAQSTLTR